MAYSNQNAEHIVDSLHTELGYDLSDAIAIALLFTNDAATVENLTKAQLKALQKSMTNIAEVSLRMILEINALRIEGNASKAKRS